MERSHDPDSDSKGPPMTIYPFRPAQEIIMRMADLALLNVDATDKGETFECEFYRGQMAGIMWTISGCDVATALLGADNLTEAARDYPHLLSAMLNGSGPDGLTPWA